MHHKPLELVYSADEASVLDIQPSGNILARGLGPPLLNAESPLDCLYGLSGNFESVLRLRRLAYFGTGKGLVPLRLLRDVERVLAEVEELGCRRNFRPCVPE